MNRIMRERTLLARQGGAEELRRAALAHSGEGIRVYTARLEHIVFQTLTDV
jgi:hypothetical protein